MKTSDHGTRQINIFSGLFQIETVFGFLPDESNVDGGKLSVGAKPA
jgi:hypothetical protein